MPHHDPLLRAKLNLESGQLHWHDIQPHFARGAVVRVSAQLDLIEVAAAMASDAKDSVTRWLETGQVARATEIDANDWNEHDPQFWAIVVAPWVLVQEIPSTAHNCSLS